MKKYLLIITSLLVVDWLWGAAQLNGIVPPWSFLLLNFPFGLLYVWFESHWTGTQYLLGNRTISDTGVLAFFFVTVFVQASFYWLLLKCRCVRDRIDGRE